MRWIGTTGAVWRRFSRARAEARTASRAREARLRAGLPAALAVGLSVCTFSQVDAAPGEFVEPGVVVIHQLEGDEGAGLFGWAVSELADIDDDGAQEAMTSAPFNGIGGELAGRVYVYSGRSGAPLFTFTGVANDRLGFAIADAGDVDDDGVTDIIAGAPNKDAPGRALLYSGADGGELGILSGGGDPDTFGAAVAGAGDLDGDGFRDVLVGAPADSSAHAGGGRVYAFAGADLSLLWIRDGDEAESSLGGATAPLGDVNDDGVPDVVAGAPGHGGAIYVLSGVDGSDVYPPLVADPGGSNLGHFFAAGLADLDDDGAPEIYGGDYGDSSGGAAAGKAYVWSGRTGARLFTFVGAAAGDGLGCGRSGGDSDGDGVADIAVGAYSSSAAGAPQAGAIFVYSGADGALLRSITGTTAMEQLGFDVVTIGDVDDDGRDDLLAAAANDNRVYVLSGVDEGDDTDGTTGTTSGDETTGEATTGDATTGDATTGGGTGSDATGPSTTTAATQGGGDSTATHGADDDDGAGCSCTSGGVDTRGARGLLILLVGLLLARRRRSPARP